MSRWILAALCCALVACSREAPVDDGYAQSPTGMPQGARAQATQDLAKAAVSDLQSDAATQATEAARDVNAEVREIVRQTHSSR